MTTLRYAFRPSAFQSGRVVVLDDTGVTVTNGDGPERRVAWSDIAEVHIEPMTVGGDKQPRWILDLAVRGGKSIRIESVDVKDARTIEHQSEAWQAVLIATLAALSGREPPVPIRYGARRYIVWMWRVALVLVTLVGLFGLVVSVVTEQIEMAIYAGVFLAFGVVGLLALRGKGAPTSISPAVMASWPAPGSD